AHFAQTVVLQAGAMISAMGGIDAIAFTGGIGEHDAQMRARIAEGLAWTGLRLDAAANAANALALAAPGSAVAAWIVPAAEEAEIADATRRLLQSG
ncbi:MAG: acetate kinase, partial [Pseudomonadota bacterium]